MRKIDLRIGWFLLVMAVSISLYGQSKVGTTAVPFLGISAGPRGTAMGGAFTGVSDDVSSLYFNPAGICRSGNSQVQFVHVKWLVETTYTWFGMMYRFDESNTIGISVTQLDYGEEPVNTVDQPEGTGEDWSASDLATGLSYARNLTDRFSIGGTMKYIRQKIWNESASAFAVDVGLLFTTQFNDMKLGMSISNFGTDMKMDGKDLLQRVDLDPTVTGNNETIVAKLKTDGWPLPLFFRVGVSMDVLRFPQGRLTCALDALRPSDNSETINAGCELSLLESVSLRAGYKSLFRDDSEEGLTLGAGLKIKYSPTSSLCLDYTFADFGLFDYVQMFSMGICF